MITRLFFVTIPFTSHILTRQFLFDCPEISKCEYVVVGGWDRNTLNSIGKHFPGVICFS